MRPSRISALLTAAVLSFSLISCSDNNSDIPRIQRYRDKEKEFRIGQSYAIDEEDIPDDIEISVELCDISEIEEKVQLLIDHIDDEKENSVIKNDIQSLLNMYDKLYEAHTNMEVVFYSNYTDKALESEYNKFYRSAYVAEDLIAHGFIYGYSNSKYHELFEGLVDKDDLSEHEGEYDLEDARIESEASFEDRTEAMSAYYDVKSNDSLSGKEKDLECAKILLDLLEDYDTDLLYSQYDRDYTGDEIIALSKSVKSELIPVYDKLMDAYFATPSWTASYDAGKNADPFKVIREYAPLLSEDIAKSADIICNEKLYSICDNDEAYPGAFTDDLPAQKKARVFIGNVGEESELSSAIHEFGHFHACLYDDTPAYLFKNNMDIAEIQSQGLELLFMQFYDDIYGDAGDSKKIEKVLDLLDSVICGFFIGEFEYTVVKNKDDMTPQEVVDLFKSLALEYDSLYNLHDIPHLFESPGYYISYATSSLAAFDIFEDYQKNPKNALEQYEKIAKTSYNSGEFTFKMALKKCGFSDVLSKDYISGLAKQLTDYAESF
ncbi:hypothetical protein [Ruminococcus flavefaciens]|uniref:Oligoendopeptidase F n=1 Tax=Ruminococcus flavefaciens TaxID=1265 RepID=A0A1M7MM95_RUMFL|nr:hypothetical protein [Ruminococcus flavefaciens]SHM92057.1 Oligoendopeptidase F [Ruminococcus flavefaciens]